MSTSYYRKSSRSYQSFFVHTVMSLSRPNFPGVRIRVNIDLDPEPAGKEWANKSVREAEKNLILVVKHLRGGRGVKAGPLKNNFFIAGSLRDF